MLRPILWDQCLLLTCQLSFVTVFTISGDEAGASKTPAAAAVHDPNEKYKIVCYYTNWSQYRPEVGKFMPEDIDPDLCTHVIFAFGWLKKGKLSSFESNDETKDGKVGLYERIAKLKEANPELKTLLAIGETFVYFFSILRRITVVLEKSIQIQTLA